VPVPPSASPIFASSEAILRRERRLPVFALCQNYDYDQSFETEFAALIDKLDPPVVR